MLSKAQRLARSEFPVRTVRAASFRFGSVKRATSGTKAAVVVSKKVCPKAVSRNALRRRVYTILRPLLARGAGSLVVYLNRAASTASFTELKAALEETLAAR